MGVDLANGGLNDATGLYDAIELCQDSGGTTISAAACTTIAGTFTQDNPLDITATDSGTTGYILTGSWTATSGVLIEGFHLCGMTAMADTEVCLLAEIGAYQETGAINLLTGDTIQVVWTISFADDGA